MSPNRAGFLFSRDRREINGFRMESKRLGASEMMCFFVLLILRNVSTSDVFSELNNNDTKQTLDCTNDLDSMFCTFEAQKCSEYSVTLQSNQGYGEPPCIFQQCDGGRCCCSADTPIVIGESFTATVFKGNQTTESKIIDIERSIKPRTPEIVTVKEDNGNFQVLWKTNMNTDLFTKKALAVVTYHKEGDTEMIKKIITPFIVNELKGYEISGAKLESRTTYKVSVRTYSDFSDLYSDSSGEKEFRTSARFDAVFQVIIICLSIAAVILSAVIYACFVKFKTKWWDKVARCPNPKLLMMHPSEREILKPMEPIISNIYVEPFSRDDSKLWPKGSDGDISSGSPQQSSGISTASSSLSYANTEPPDIIASRHVALGEVFASLSPTSPLILNPLQDSGLLSSPYNPCDGVTNDTSSGSSVFENKTYSILIPGCQRQNTTVESAYQPSEGDTSACSDQQIPACPVLSFPPVDASPMPTDMSYQQCNADSGRCSCPEDSSLSSVSSCTITVMSCDPVSSVEAFSESSNKPVGGVSKLNGNAEEAIICDENPCYGCVPAGSHSFPMVDDDYQPFQNVTAQPDVLLAEKRSSEDEERLDKYLEESYKKMMPQSLLSPAGPGFINSVHGGQRPFLPLISANQLMPVITDSSYQSV